MGWKSRVAAVKRELVVYRRVMLDPRTPRAARWLLGLALAYLVSPIDLIPDFIPILGQLDDLVIVPLLVVMALTLIDDDLVDEHRQRLAAELQ